MKILDKLYVNTVTTEYSHDNRWKHKNEKIIEYTRTDAFIEKACNWLQAELAFYHKYHNISDIDMDSLIKDFRKALEE